MNYPLNDYTVARPGHKSVATKVAQRLLNSHRLPGEPWLEDDGVFGTRTLQAAHRFQLRTPPLKQRDRVGPKTFTALGLQAVKSYEVRLQPQRKGGQCWAAAASMMLGGRLPVPKLAKTDRRGALVADDANVADLGRDLHWDFFNAASDVARFAAALERAPVWLGGQSLDMDNHVDAVHAVVVAGLFTYPWKGRTMILLKIYDPWPLSRGRIYFMEWGDARLPSGNRFNPKWLLSPAVWAP